MPDWSVGEEMMLGGDGDSPISDKNQLLPSAGEIYGRVCLNVANFALIRYLRVMHAWATAALVEGASSARGSVQISAWWVRDTADALFNIDNSPEAEWAQII